MPSRLGEDSDDYFMCQLYWVKEYQIAKKILFRGVSIKVFLGEIKSKLVNKIKQMAIPSVDRHHTILSDQTEQKA